MNMSKVEIDKKSYHACVSKDFMQNDDDKKRYFKQNLDKAQQKK